MQSLDEVNLSLHGKLIFYKQRKIQKTEKLMITCVYHKSIYFLRKNL